jgi:hypothetical protein
MDLRNLLKALLNPVPAERPTCSDILKMNIVQKRMRKYFNEKDGYSLMFEDQHPENVMMNTFVIQKNIYKLALPWD